VASCCGHDQLDATIKLADGRELKINKALAVRPWEKISHAEEETLP
jgi:hypothetical protein